MIRPAAREDVPAMLALYGPYVSQTTVSFEYDIPTEEEFSERFLNITQQYPWLVWEEEGRISGYAYASSPYTRAGFAWCAEPSIYLVEYAKGTGIGKKLYEALEKILFYQGYQVLYALITAENLPSVRFHEKMGYLRRAVYPRCGFKFDRWLDLIWMEKTLNFVETPSNFPVPWSAIIQNAEIPFHILDTIPLS